MPFLEHKSYYRIVHLLLFEVFFETVKAPVS